MCGPFSFTQEIPEIVALEACRGQAGGGGLLPSNRLMGMCRWMGSHFHCWIDNNRVAFSLELLEWDCTFSRFGGSENSGK